VAREPPGLGDMLLVWLCLEAVRHHLAGSEPPRWGDFLAGLPAESRNCLRNLAAHSPFARLAAPDLGEDLEAHAVRWVDLGRFLGDPAGEPLFSFAVDRLLAEVLPSPERMTRGLELVLRECLGSSNLGGALFVAEFFHALARHVFGDCQANAVFVEG